MCGALCGSGLAVRGDAGLVFRWRSFGVGGGYGREGVCFFSVGAAGSILACGLGYMVCLFGVGGSFRG